MQITLDITNANVQLLIDGAPCFPQPVPAPFQWEWMCQAILWHLDRRGWEGTAVLFREPFEESPYPKAPLRTTVSRSKPNFSKPKLDISLEDLGL